MAYNEASKKATLKYAASHLKRVPLDMQLEEYDQLKAAAEASGEKVNTYIKTAIKMRMEENHDR